MPEIKDYIYYGIYYSTILVTAIFSCLVWKATKASAEVAKVTLMLNQQLINKDEEREVHERNVVRSHYIRKLFKDSQIVHNSLVSIDSMEVLRALQTAPKELPIEIKGLAKYFTGIEVELINKAWNTYEYFLRLIIRPLTKVMKLTYWFRNLVKQLGLFIIYLNTSGRRLFNIGVFLFLGPSAGGSGMRG